MGNGRGNDEIGNKLSFPPNVFRGTQKYLLVAAERCTFWDCYILTHQSTSCHLRTYSCSHHHPWRPLDWKACKSLWHGDRWWTLHCIPYQRLFVIPSNSSLGCGCSPSHPPDHHHMQIPEMQSMALWTAITIIYPFLTAPTTRVVSPPDPAFNRTEYASHSFRLQRGRMEFTEIPLRVDLHLAQ